MKKTRSTGPRSVEGKAASSMNALKSGIYARGEIVLPTEKQKDLEILTAEYYARFSPDTPEQRCLVDALISDEWLLRRFRLIEAQQLNRKHLFLSCPDELSPLAEAYEMTDKILTRLQHRVNATRRNYRQTLEILNQLQAPVPEPPSRLRAPRPPEPAPEQFVPSTPVAARQPLPAAPVSAPLSTTAGAAIDPCPRPASSPSPGSYRILASMAPATSNSAAAAPPEPA